MKIYVLLLSLLSAAPSYAQYVVRNGGYTVQCLNSPIKALEIAEAEAQNIQIRYAPSRTYLAKSKDLITRIGLVDPAKEKKYLTWLSQWKSQIKWVSALDQYGPNDQGHIELPGANCRLRVGVVQVNETRFGVQEHWINPSVWHNLNEDQKAALVLHELVYRDLLEENPNANSSYVRSVNTKIHSIDIFTERKEFIDLIKAL